MEIAALVEDVLGSELPVGVRAYDGSAAGPEDAPATLVVRSPDAIRRILGCPGRTGAGLGGFRGTRMGTRTDRTRPAIFAPARGFGTCPFSSALGGR